ncbi:hypothetical protein GH714_038513 [Hevea brasiliensis]|uniref:Protein-tyrosine-phosphatase MKP1 C-terminal domain-containing protein n=1 Tax=Hevea brasiliensis TaxID=3981 RepID=A0A6A6N6N1_HEVBR|nr:hypothetical protein GH714_038513 [Hevea brasiliensis]
MDKSSHGVDIGPSAIKICPGERKVDVNNVDFEIFQKAIKGGFVPSIAPSENEHEIHLPARESSWSVLRRKFAPVDMKEFISAPKIFLSRVYSDSMMIVHSSSPSSSSSSSPPYLSPDSISSDSSTSSKYSESSLDSPSPASCSVLVSSPSSNFDNLSLLSSKASSRLPSDTPGHRAVYSMSNQCSQVTSSTSKKSSPSLAERRESKNQAKGGKDSMEKSKLNISQDRLVSADSSDREAAFVNNCDGPDRYCLSGEGLGCSIANGIQENVSSCNIMQSLVCHWPSLERIATFGTSNLDSKAAFAILAPATGLGRDGSRILYFG